MRKLFMFKNSLHLINGETHNFHPWKFHGNRSKTQRVTAVYVFCPHLGCPNFDTEVEKLTVIKIIHSLMLMHIFWKLFNNWSNISLKKRYFKTSKTRRISLKLRGFRFSTSGLNQNSKTLKTSENILKFDSNYQKRNTSKDRLCRLANTKVIFSKKIHPVPEMTLLPSPLVPNFLKMNFFIKQLPHL